MSMKGNQEIFVSVGKTVWMGLLVVIFLLVSGGCAQKIIRIGEPLSADRRVVVNEVIDLVGKPYRVGGRGPDAFDCSGLVYHVYKKAGLILPVTAEEQGLAGVATSREATLPGDIVVFKIDRGFHVGIMLNEREFIHASKSRGVAISDLLVPYWSRNLRGFRSFL